MSVLFRVPVSEFGFQVTCIDKDAAKIDALKNGIIPIYEPGLDDPWPAIRRRAGSVLILT